MKMKTLLLAITFFAASSLYAQTLFDQKGNYKGPDHTSVKVDFTKSSENALSEPIVEEIRQYDCLGLIRYAISNKEVLGEGGKKNVLFNNNPTINGKKNQDGGSPTIYFPKLANGANKIRIKGWVLGGAAQPLQLSAYNEATGKWVWKQAITIPRDGSNLVEADINIDEPVQLRLLYNKTSWIYILSIEISAFGEELSAK